MKRVICLMLALLLLLLTGCQYNESGGILEPVEFYYPRTSEGFLYGTDSGVFAAEAREASGHTGDLNYLISMYLHGPQSENLRSPFPADCTLEQVRAGGNTLNIVLSEAFMQLEGTELTLACAGLAQTFLPISGMQRIRIDSGAGEKTFTTTLYRDSLLLADFSAFETPEE